MRGRLVTLILMAGALLAGCSAPRATPDGVEAESAGEALTSFLDMLAQGKYAEAVPVYAGPLDSLWSFNPDLDPQDAEGLIGYACGQQLLQCLPVHSVSLASTGPGGELTFEVEFRLSDGSVFVLGPCCGASETEMPPVSSFAFRVRRQPDGEYVVLDLPPYVP